MFLLEWLERHSRYLQFSKMLSEGELQPGGAIKLPWELVQTYRQTKTVSQLIGLGYAYVEREKNGGKKIILVHTEDIEQIIKATKKVRFSSRRKLKAAVSSEKFQNLLNDPIDHRDSLYAAFTNDASGIPDGRYIVLSQPRILTWRCVEEIAELMRRHLAFIHPSCTKTVYLSADYMERLNFDDSFQIDSDLSGFRVLLGEPSNIRRMIIAVEAASYDPEDGMLLIDLNSDSGSKIRLEVSSLVNMKIARFVGSHEVKIPPAIAGWLLDEISSSSDRISLADVLHDTLS